MKRKLIFLLSTVFLIVICYSILNIFEFKTNLFSIGRESEEDEFKKEGKDKPEKFQEYYRAITTRIGEKYSKYLHGYAMLEFQKATSRQYLKSVNEQLPWKCRGPYNISGRVRSIILDPDDATNSTWFVGSASGGVWKTSDAGKTWSNISGDLPNLATTALAMAESNHNIIYAGTGEGFGAAAMVTGSGVFKSSDKGVTWKLLSQTGTNKDFSFINRIIVNPIDENHVLICTNTGIFRSFDGGISWKSVFSNGLSVQDLKTEPRYFQTQYAGVNSFGVIKSTDGGETWQYASNGMGNCGRVELAISPINPNKLYACTEVSDSLTFVYCSTNRAISWSKFKPTSSDNFVDYLAKQGWYDNAIVCHPFNDSIVYIGGVYLGSYKFSKQTQLSDPQIIKATPINTESFLSFVNFGGQFLGGGLELGNKNNAINLVDNDWCAVELRFGSGISQLAHRFTVPTTSGTNGDGGAGVPTSSYSYSNYIQVPFQAWDVTHNRQLMISFRDQNRDGAFNLINRNNTSDETGREYLFVNALPYNTLPDANISKNGGQAYKQLYFLWPTLASGATWNANSLPESKIQIDYGQMKYTLGQPTTVSDGRGDRGFINRNLHPDHHAMIPIPIDKARGTFYILNGNDGGVGISKDQGNTWTQLAGGLINTQFYGVDKKPGKQEYIGGMQDNGTWKSPTNVNAQLTTNYIRSLDGDGFSTIWNSKNASLIIGSVYNNRLYLSKNGGSSWAAADKGINEDGPFITRLSNSDARPDVVFAVGTGGVWKTTSFAVSTTNTWTKVPINEGWSIDESVTSMHNVAVSLTNPDVVWAGAGMLQNPYLALSVSINGGTSFSATSVFNSLRMGYISGLATHPTNANEAFALFSISGAPKILRTMNLGKTWSDISGFDKGVESTNGFPNVMINCLLVMPTDTNRLWAGTEIGLFESTDNGKTWAYANNGLPPVSIWQIKVRDNEVVVATHGRGIWTSSLPEKEPEPKPIDTLADVTSFYVYPNPVIYVLTDSLTSNYIGTITKSIYSIDGRLMYREFPIKDKQSIVSEINVSFLKPGVYVLVVDYQNQRITKKFVKKKNY